MTTAWTRMTGPDRPMPADHRLVLVTGPSGAGRTTAIRALEDLGYEVIDNLPLSLVPRLIDGPPLGRPIALGLDVRNRDFNATALIELIDRLTRDPRVALEVLYLDCAAGELIRRYSETRRRHPLAPDETPAAGDRARDRPAGPDPGAGRSSDRHHRHVAARPEGRDRRRGSTRGEAARLAVSVQSFSYKRGLPRGVDMVFDCRFLRNPALGSRRCAHWTAATRRSWPLSRADPRFAPNSSAKLTRSGPVSASGPSGRGQGASADRLWLHRRATPVGCRCGKTGQSACRGRLAGVKTAPGTGTQGGERCSRTATRVAGA